MSEARSGRDASRRGYLTLLLPSALAVALIAVAFGLTAARAVTLGMPTHPAVHVVNAIPVALTELYFGHPKTYMALAGVRKRFLDQLPRSFRPHDIASPSPGEAINPAIQKVFIMDRDRVGTELVPLGPDDKGIVDLIELSFVSFGYRIENVTLGYFVLLLLSCLAYVAAFWRSPSRLLLGAALLAMLYLALPMVAYNAQLGSILTLRALPVLSMLACLHCLLFMAGSLRERVSTAQLGLVAVQATLIAFALHLRTATIWQVVAVVGFGALVLIAASVGRLGFRQVSLRSTALAVGATICLVVGGYVAVQQYQAVALKEYERRGQIATRVFWHNIFSGLAYHPEFGERFQIRIDDSSIFAAMRTYLTEQGRLDEWRDMGGEQPDFSELQFAKYDPMVREMLIARCSTYLRECAEAMLYYKPAALAGNLAWLYGLRSLPPELDIVVPRGAEEVSAQVKHQYIDASRRMDETGQRAYLWTPLVLLLVTPFALLLALEPRGSIWTAFAACLALLLGSLIPTVIGYPLPHTILEPSIALGMAFYFGICFLVATWLPRVLAHRWPGQQAAEAPTSLSTAMR